MGVGGAGKLLLVEGLAAKSLTETPSSLPAAALLSWVGWGSWQRAERRGAGVLALRPKISRKGGMVGGGCGGCVELVDGVGGGEDRREHETDKARPQDTQHDTQARQTQASQDVVGGW